MTTLAYISFTSPLMWGGMVLAAFPLVAHWLNRRSRRRLVFPSLMLLRDSAAEQARLNVIRRWMLLMLRVLAVTLLVAAFARPVWHATSLAASSAIERNAVVLVVDASASMQASHTGVTRYDLAKRAAVRVLGDLRRGTDIADIVFITGQSEAVFRELSPNLPELIAQLESRRATAEVGDPTSAIRLAAQILQGHAGPKRLLVFSDLQASNWEPLLKRTPGETIPSDIIFRVVELGTKPIQNLACRMPNHAPPEPLAGQSVTLSVDVYNDGEQTQQARIDAWRDGAAIESRDLQIDAHGTQSVSFESPGQSRSTQLGMPIEFRLNHDAFSLDDRAYWSFGRYDEIQVALLSDDDPQQPGTAAFYLSLALTPYGDRNDRFSVRPLTTRDIERTTAKEWMAARVVFVGYLGVISSDAAQRLYEYVEAGGVLVVFCGEGTVRRNLQELDAVAPQPWLPWTIGGRQDLRQRSDVARITTGDWRSPLLSEFDATSQLALAAIRFDYRWDVQLVQGDAESLLSYEDGEPALAKRSVGIGQVVLANFSPASDASDLGKHGSFVALIQMMAQRLAMDERQQTRFYVGDSLACHLERAVAPTAVQLLDPAGEDAHAAITVQGTGLRLELPRATQLGHYQVKADGEVVDVIPVNLHPSESEFKAIEPRELLASLLGGVTEADTEKDTDVWARPIDLQGKPLWGWAIVTAMLLASVEMTLVGWWRR